MICHSNIDVINGLIGPVNLSGRRSKSHYLVLDVGIELFFLLSFQNLATSLRII